MRQKLGDLANRVRENPRRAVLVAVDKIKEPAPLFRGGPIANRLGLQVARTLKRYATRRMRPFTVPEYVRPHVEALERDGLLIIENFLPADDFKALEVEYAAMNNWPQQERFKFYSRGENLEVRQVAATEFADDLPVLMRTLRDNPMIYDIARSITRRSATYPPRMFIHEIYKPDQDQPCTDDLVDSYLHTDRHYRFVKAFYCIGDMTEEAAPYTYVKGSHRFNRERLRYEYESAIAAAKHKRDPQQQVNELKRLAEELMNKLGLEETRIVAKKNSLILTDNAGLHRRNAMVRGRRITAQMDYKFLESLGQPLYPLLRPWGSGL
ncbi:MAG: phytanoyl-CoA dioxygenase family protein [Allosphingosinicella sp.]